MRNTLKTRQFKPTRFWVSLVLLLAGIMVVALSPLFSDTWENYRMRIAFDSAGWKSHTPADGGIMWPARLRMAEDLMSSGRLKGLTRAEVVLLLGASGDSDNSSGKGRMSYYLGPERGVIRIDSERLVIEFGDDGRVRAWHTATD